MRQLFDIVKLKKIKIKKYHYQSEKMNYGVREDI